MSEDGGSYRRRPLRVLIATLPHVKKPERRGSAISYVRNPAMVAEWQIVALLRKIGVTVIEYDLEKMHSLVDDRFYHDYSASLLPEGDDYWSNSLPNLRCELAKDVARKARVDGEDVPYRDVFISLAPPLTKVAFECSPSMSIIELIEFNKFPMFMTMYTKGEKDEAGNVMAKDFVVPRVHALYTNNALWTHVVSHMNDEYIVEPGAYLSDVIRPTVWKEQLEEDDSELPFENYFLFVGRGGLVDGFTMALAAFCAARQQNKEFKLVVVGGTREHYGLSESATFVHCEPFSTLGRKARLMKSALALLYTTTLPSASSCLQFMLEALVCETPVLAFVTAENRTFLERVSVVKEGDVLYPFSRNLFELSNNMQRFTGKKRGELVKKERYGDFEIAWEPTVFETLLRRCSAQAKLACSAETAAGLLYQFVDSCHVATALGELGLLMRQQVRNALNTTTDTVFATPPLAAVEKAVEEGEDGAVAKESDSDSSCSSVNTTE